MNDDAPPAIRFLVAEDWPAWHGLWDAYLAFYETALPEERSRAVFEKLLGRTANMYSILAHLEGRAVGMCNFLTHPSCWTERDYCYLQDLYVVPAARGRHVGRRLIERVYAEARNLDADRVYWLTKEDNHTAQALYDRVAARSGFIQYRKML